MDPIGSVFAPAFGTHQMSTFLLRPAYANDFDTTIFVHEWQIKSKDRQINPVQIAVAPLQILGKGRLMMGFFCPIFSFIDCIKIK